MAYTIDDMIREDDDIEITEHELWYKLNDPNDRAYTPYKVSKRVCEYVGDGTEPFTPRQVAEYLNKYPQAEIDGTGMYFERRAFQETDSQAVKLPPGIYKYAESNGGRFPERLIAMNLRHDRMIPLGDVFNKVEEDIKAFLSAEQIYADAGTIYKMGILMWGPPGNGKCLKFNTDIIMFNGTIKKVQDIKSGDLLMGPDSRARLVKSTTSGREKMYEVQPLKGDAWGCNESHILSLVMNDGADKNGIVNISVKDYLSKSNNFKHHAKLYRASVNFPAQEEYLRIDPYVLGCWLGDGDTSGSKFTNKDSEFIDALTLAAQASGLVLSNTSPLRYGIRSKEGTKGKNGFLNALNHYELIGNKHIPHGFKTASREDRLQLLAGLLDSDGSVNCGGFDYISKLEILTDDICFVARSLGFAAYKTPCKKACTYKGEKREGNYFRVCISGDCSEIPVKIERKKAAPRKQIKNVLRTGFTLEERGEGDYYGFELSGDGLFLLGDFTVSHNTTLIRKILNEALPSNAIVVFIEDKFPSSFFLHKIQASLDKRLTVFVFEEMATTLSQSYIVARVLDFLDGETSVDRSIILSTTNYPDKIPGNIVNRPSRFDKLYNFDNPKDSGRGALIQHFLKQEATPDMVAATKDFSVADIKEVCLEVLIKKVSFAASVDTIKKRTQLCRKQFATNVSRVGFGD